MIQLDNVRVSTMRKRLGKAASAIIKNDAFLPLFRNRQKRFPEEFEESVRIAQKKRNPYRYLAKIWAVENIKNSLKLLRGMLNRAAAKWQEAQQIIRNNTAETTQHIVNQSKINRYIEMRDNHNLFRLQ